MTISNAPKMPNNTIGLPETPHVFKNILLLATAGVIGSIVFALLLRLLLVLIFSGAQSIPAYFTLPYFLSVFFGLPNYLLAFGLVIALAYQYKCMHVNARNLALCIGAAVILEAFYQALFSTPLYSSIIYLYVDWGRNRGWSLSYVNIFLPLVSSIPSFVTALIATVFAWIFFRCCAKSDSSDITNAHAQNRFVMLLAFVCVLSGLLIAMTHHQTAIAFFQFTEQFAVLNDNSFLRSAAYLLFANISVFIFIWLSYQFAAVSFPKAHVTAKRNVAGSALLSLALFFVFCIVTGVLFALGISTMSFYGATPNEVLAVSIPVAIAGFIGVCVCVRSVSVAMVLLALCAVQLAGFLFFAEYLRPEMGNYEKVVLLTSVSFLLALEMVAWLLYSIAIRIGIRKMIGMSEAI